MNDLGDVLFHLDNRHGERDSSTGGDLDQQSHLEGNMIVWGLMEGGVSRPAVK
jgi:hypothetical protein